VNVLTLLRAESLKVSNAAQTCEKNIMLVIHLKGQRVVKLACLKRPSAACLRASGAVGSTLSGCVARARCR
jgi:hypothetical protein